MVCIDACKNMGQVVLSCKTPSNSNPVCECSPDKENRHCAAYCPAECQKKNQTVLSCDAVSKECECSPGIQLLSTGVVYHRYFIICKSYKYSNVTCFWRNFLLTIVTESSTSIFNKLIKHTFSKKTVVLFGISKILDLQELRFQ